MSSERMNKFKLNNDWFDANTEAVFADAPSDAVHVLVHDESVVGYYSNSIDVMDALMLKKGAIIRDLDYGLLRQQS